MRNRTFRVFVSSTFNDFLAERQCLSEEISRVVGDYCQSKGYDLQLIDLRWGISEESALNQKTIPICLEEVRRCHFWSPKPNFLLMVGERYGWVPLPFVIKKTELERFLAVCSPEDRKLLEQWYWFDGNAAGGEYYLCPRQGEYEKEEKWDPVQKELQRILTGAAGKCRLAPQDMLRYTASATEQEIIEGFLGNSDICDNTVAVFRNGYKDRDPDQAKIRDLRRRIRDKMTRDGVIHNLFELDYGGDYILRFCRTVTSALLRSIEAEISRLEQLNASRSEEASLASLASIGGGEFYGRSRELSLLNEYVCGRERRPLFVTGASGCGKSSLLAEFIRRTGRSCFFSFYGTDDSSYSVYGAVNGICRQIRAHYSMENAFFITPYNLLEAFWDTVTAIPPEEPAIILLDGIDMLQEQQKAFDLLMLPELPENVKLIVSAASEAAPAMPAPEGCPTLSLPPFGPEDSRTAFAQMLRAQGRCLSGPDQKELIEKILAEECLPLQLRLMADICSGWRSADRKTDFPETPEGAALYYIRSMFEDFGHDQELVLYSLAFILAAPYGIGEDDLQRLLPQVDVVRRRFAESSYHAFDASKLPYAIWSRLFFDLGKCLRTVNWKGYIVVRVCHNVFYRVFLEAYPGYYNRARDILISYYVQMPNYLDDAKLIPNRKKCISVLPLLLSADRKQEADALLQDITFVDAACKSGSLEDMLSAYRTRIAQAETDDLRSRLAAIEACLLQNRDMLDYYRGSAYSCLQAAGLNGSFSPTISCVSGRDLPARAVRPFPYSASSLLAWSGDGTLLAAAHGRYIHLFDGEAREELRTVYTASLSDGAYSISHILWPGARYLAAQMTDRSIQIYHIEGKNVRHVFTVENALPEAKAVTDGEGLLLYYTDSGGGFLCAFHVFSGREVYRIRQSINGSVDNISLIGNDLIVTNGTISPHADFYDLSTGEKKCRISVQVSSNTSSEFTNLFRFGEDNWLLIPTAGLGAHQIGQYKGPRNGKKRLALQFYLYPPQYTQITAYLIGKSSLVLVYKNRLIWMEPAAGLAMYALEPGTILRAVWREKDRSLSVLCGHGLTELTREDFLNTAPARACFTAGKNLTPYRDRGSVLAERTSDDLLHSFGGKLFRDFYSYRSVFSRWSAFSIGNENTFPQSATLLVFAADGKYAAAYEGLDQVVIFDEDHRPLLALRRLRLAVINSILKMGFSGDSRFFLLWRSCSIEVFSLGAGRRIIKLDLSWRPALFVSFSSDSLRLEVTLCDGRKYIFSLPDPAHSKTKIPKRLIARRGFRYALPYIADPFSEAPEAIALAEDINGPPSKWFRPDRLYFGERHHLLFKDGSFYLDSDLNLPFAAPYESFRLALQAERNRDRTAVDGFLREKNDISSKVLEPKDGRHLILISRMLNSVIVFDTAGMTVLSACKHHGDIIGWRDTELQNGDIRLELYSNSDPFVRELVIHIS